MKTEKQNKPLDVNSEANQTVYKVFRDALAAYPHDVSLQYAYFRGAMRTILEKEMK